MSITKKPVEQDVWPPAPTGPVPNAAGPQNSVAQPRSLSMKIIDFLTFGLGLISLILFVHNLALHIDPNRTASQPTFACMAYILGAYTYRKGKRSQLFYIGFWLGQTLCIIWGIMTLLNAAHN